jgi:simple sugar transport system permease protein
MVKRSVRTGNTTLPPEQPRAAGDSTPTQLGAGDSRAPRREPMNGHAERSRASQSKLSALFARPVAGIAVGTLAVYVFFAIAAGGGFTSLNGTASWLNQGAELAIVAVPVGLLMIAGEFDLSIASVISAAALIVAIGTGHYELPLLVSIALAFAGAALIGLLNGVVTTQTGLPSFIVTLATFFGLAGASLALSTALTGGTTVRLDTSGWLHSVFAANPHQFNVSILWCLAVTAVAGYVLSKMVFGNWLLATGGDKIAAREAGVPTSRVKITLFIASSLGAALLGVVQAVEYSGSYVGQGQNFIFDAIVASVVGGVLLHGGYGSALGVLLGAMTYSIVRVGIQYTGWNSNLTELFIGALVLAAVLANTFMQQLAVREQSRGKASHAR